MLIEGQSPCRYKVSTGAKRHLYRTSASFHRSCTEAKGRLLNWVIRNGLQTLADGALGLKMSQPAETEVLVHGLMRV